MRKISFPLLVLCTLAAAGPALAETIGRVTASLDGAAERTWFAHEEGGESQSFWFQTMPGSLNAAGFSIWANPAEGADVTDDVIVLGATLLRGPAGYVAIADLEYLENAYSAYWTNPGEDTARIDLTRVEEEGDRLIVEGSFTAPVFYTENAANPQTDMTRTMTITGTFSARLPRE